MKHCWSVQAKEISWLSRLEFLNMIRHFLSFQMTSSTALRFVDVGLLSKRMLAPLDGYENCHEPKDGLTSDESASIMLYTLESNSHVDSLYVILNATNSSFGFSTYVSC